jgi:hypothetical protein
METKVKWQWAIDAHNAGYTGCIVDEEGYLIAQVSTIQGMHKIQPILEHIIELHNASLETN